MKKKIKDLTEKEVRKICEKYNESNCVNCPLYFIESGDWDGFCWYDVKKIEDEIVEVEEDEKEHQIEELKERIAWLQDCYDTMEQMGSSSIFLGIIASKKFELEEKLEKLEK